MVERKRLSQKRQDELLVEEMDERRGPKTKYDPRFAKIAQQLCERGATDQDLADAFEVNTSTIQQWQTKFPGFGAAVRSGKSEVFDPKVERALAMKALGYTVDTEEIKVTKDGDVIRVPVRKHYAPDTTAAIFWLKNRQPDRWRDVWKIDHSGKMELDKLSSEQVLEELRKDIRELGLGGVAAQLGIAAEVSKPNGKGNGTKH